MPDRPAAPLQFALQDDGQLTAVSDPNQRGGNVDGCDAAAELATNQQLPWCRIKCRAQRVLRVRREQPRPVVEDRPQVRHPVGDRELGIAFRENPFRLGPLRQQRGTGLGRGLGTDRAELPEQVVPIESPVVRDLVLAGQALQRRGLHRIKRVRRDARDHGPVELDLLPGQGEDVALADDLNQVTVGDGCGAFDGLHPGRVERQPLTG